MTDHDGDHEDHTPKDTTEDTDAGVESAGRRTVLKSAAGVTAMGALGAQKAAANLPDAVVTPLQRDRIPPNQGARN